MELEKDYINAWGGMYRTQYLVLSRTLLEGMSSEWQQRFVALMEDVGNEFDINSREWPVYSYDIQCKDENGRYIQDPWGIYRYPNRELLERFRINKEGNGNQRKD